MKGGVEKIEQKNTNKGLFKSQKNNVINNNNL